MNPAPQDMPGLHPASSVTKGGSAPAFAKAAKPFRRPMVSRSSTWQLYSKEGEWVFIYVAKPNEALQRQTLSEPHS